MDRMEPTLDNILKASMAARDHARRQIEGCYPEHSSALNRFDEEVKQAENGQILRIRPEKETMRRKNRAKAWISTVGEWQRSRGLAR